MIVIWVNNLLCVTLNLKHYLNCWSKDITISFNNKNIIFASKIVLFSLYECCRVGNTFVYACMFYRSVIYCLLSKCDAVAILGKVFQKEFHTF